MTRSDLMAYRVEILMVLLVFIVVLLAWMLIVARKTHEEQRHTHRLLDVISDQNADIARDINVMSTSIRRELALLAADLSRPQAGLPTTTPNGSIDYAE